MTGGYLFNLTKNREISEVIENLELPPLSGDKDSYKINRVDFAITKKGLEVLRMLSARLERKRL